MRIEEESQIDIRVVQRLRKELPGAPFLFDIDIDEDGDIAHQDSFDTAIKMSLFCERRATASEQVIPEKRRGWIGNEASEVQGFEIGSKLWLLFQSRLTQQEVNAAVDYANQAFEWFIDDQLLESVVVVGSRTQAALILNITFFRFNNRVDSRLFKIWNNTGTLEDDN